MNLCIDKDFFTSTEIATLQQTLDEKCTNEEKMEVFEKIFGKSAAAITKLEAELNTVKSQVEYFKQENEKLMISLMKVESLNELKSQGNSEWFQKETVEIEVNVKTQC